MPNKRPENGQNRDSKGRFVSGGNPHGGRKKKPPELKQAADEALEMLIEMMHDDKTNDKLKADIGVKLYEWQYGKATQRVAGDKDEAAIRIEIPDAIRELSE